MADTTTHGLGRLPSVPDQRDLRLSDLGPNPATVSALDAALALFLRTRTGKAHAQLLALIVDALQGREPAPPPPPAVAPRLWRDVDSPILDQRDTGHCVGFSSAAFLADPGVVDTTVTDSTGHDLYYRCKVADGEPQAENGSYVRTAAKVLQAAGRLGVYAFASTTGEITDWLTQRGPVIVGTDWYQGMFTPDPAGVVHVTGTLAGGHAYLLVGACDSLWHPVAASEATHYALQNSWGRDWGKGGLALISIAEFDRLLARQGEALVSVELPR